jgi:aminomethyltransferase
MPSLKRTPLYAAHERLGARMMEFAGFLMPVQYSSIRAEHTAVREAAGLFDVSHMGQLGIEGAGALAGADALLTRAASDLAPGRIRYALLCNEAGGVVDDVTVYRLSETAVLLVVNAANVAKDLAWVRGHLPADAQVVDRSAETALLALQGPAAAETLARVSDPQVTGLRRYRFEHGDVAGRRALVSRTGYTGADGFEIYLGAGDAEHVFEALLAAGKPLGLLPAGLGARDTLRLEAALPLYGHELDDRTSPLEARLDRFVDLEDREFIGAESIRRRRDAGHPRLLAGFQIETRGVARAGYPVAVDGETVGAVTSGGPSPTLGTSIGLAYVPPPLAEVGAGFDVMIRGRATPARVVPTPFVTGEEAGRRAR